MANKTVVTAAKQVKAENQKPLYSPNVTVWIANSTRPFFFEYVLLYGFLASEIENSRILNSLT